MSVLYVCFLGVLLHRKTLKRLVNGRNHFLQTAAIVFGLYAKKSYRLAQMFLLLYPKLCFNGVYEQIICTRPLLTAVQLIL